jgi:hypothetical protein
MKKKVALLVGTISSANGICTIEMAKEFASNGYETHIVCFDDHKVNDNYKKNEIYYHTVKRSFIDPIRDKWNNTKKIRYRILLYIIAFFNYFNYPFLDPFLNRRYYKVVSKLYKENKFDIMISVYNPVESIYSVKKLKKKYDFFSVLYTLDTMTNTYRKKTLLNKYRYMKNKIYESVAYKKLDMIINMECHKEHYTSKKYEKFFNKMFLSDIPLLIKSDNNKIKSDDKLLNKEKYNFTYTGALDYARRNPTYICKLFNILYEHDNNVCANFFGGGDAQDIIRKNMDGGAVIYHGLVDHKLIPIIINESDIMINLEAKNSDMVSAKIFEYMSFNKKIVHFYSNDNDVMIPYLKRYSNSLLISEKDSIEDNVKKVLDFMKKDENKNNNTFKEFRENTPNYTFELITKEYQKWEVQNEKDRQ